MTTIIIMLLLVIISICTLIGAAKRRKVINTFKNTSVLVGGARGKGKDMLMNYVVSKRNNTYISNIQYAEAEKGNEKSKKKDGKWIEFDPLKQWGLGGNTNRDFIEDTLHKYEYQYNDGIDYYISDIGVYFPSQDFAILNARYKSATAFQALARHLGDCNVHANTQAFNRVWDKIREQFETYILCRKCKVTFGRFIKQKITIYDNYESACMGIEPIPSGIGKKARQEKAKFIAEHGHIQKMTIRYILKKKYDTRRFKKILAEAPER